MYCLIKWSFQVDCSRDGYEKARTCHLGLARCPFAQTYSPHYHKTMALTRHKVWRQKMNPFFPRLLSLWYPASRNHLSRLPFVSLCLSLVLRHKWISGQQMGWDFRIYPWAGHGVTISEYLAASKRRFLQKVLGILPFRKKEGWILSRLPKW